MSSYVCSGGKFGRTCFAVHSVLKPNCSLGILAKFYARHTEKSSPELSWPTNTIVLINSGFNRSIFQSLSITHSVTS